MVIQQISYSYLSMKSNKIEQYICFLFELQHLGLGVRSITQNFSKDSMSVFCANIRDEILVYVIIFGNLGLLSQPIVKLPWKWIYLDRTYYHVPERLP